MKSVRPAHQYLSKPCDAETLKTSVARACRLREILGDDTLKEVVTRMDSLPSMPALYQEIQTELASPDASIQKIGEIISKDVGMTAKILQLVNSRYRCPPTRNLRNPPWKVLRRCPAPDRRSSRRANASCTAW